ncbi:hypothetical protein RFI_03979, partial [Reticulomyxa filosa]
MSTEEDKKWFEETHKRVLTKLLPGIPPNGSNFATLVKGMLDTDYNWLQWKYSDGDKASDSKDKDGDRCLQMKKPPDLDLTKYISAHEHDLELPVLERLKVSNNTYNTYNTYMYVHKSMTMIYDKDKYSFHQLSSQKEQHDPVLGTNVTMMGHTGLCTLWQYMPEMFDVECQLQKKRQWNSQVGNTSSACIASRSMYVPANPNEGLEWLQMNRRNPGFSFTEISKEYVQKKLADATDDYELAEDKLGQTDLLCDDARFVFESLRVFRENDYELFHECAPLDQYLLGENALNTEFVRNAMMNWHKHRKFRFPQSDD